MYARAGMPTPEMRMSSILVRNFRVTSVHYSCAAPGPAYTPRYSPQSLMEMPSNAK